MGRLEFKNAIFIGANFSGARLRNVDLRGAINLTDEQIGQALLGEDVILPDGTEAKVQITYDEEIGPTEAGWHRPSKIRRY